MPVIAIKYQSGIGNLKLKLEVMWPDEQTYRILRLVSGVYYLQVT